MSPPPCLSPIALSPLDMLCPVLSVVALSFTALLPRSSATHPQHRTAAPPPPAEKRKTPADRETVGSGTGVISSIVGSHGTGVNKVMEYGKVKVVETLWSTHKDTY